MKRYCLALDLKDDPALIAAYEDVHQKVWPEIIASIREAGITSLEIYRTHTRLLMVMEVNDDFSFEKKTAADAANPKVQQWEDLMWRYQQALPHASPGQKWMLMEKIFDLNAF
jgi:L-rhamnose mutarotase